jgi:hypothetical protein
MSFSLMSANARAGSRQRGRPLLLGHCSSPLFLRRVDDARHKLVGMQSYPDEDALLRGLEGLQHVQMCSINLISACLISIAV